MNARLFNEKGAAELLIQGKAKGEDLAKLIRSYYTAPDRITQMERSVTQFYRPQSAKDIVSALAPRS